MDAKKKAESNDEVGKRTEPTLSEIIAVNGKYLKKEALDSVLAHAKMLQSDQEPKNSRDQAWLLDFINNIGIVIMAEREIDDLVNLRTQPRIEAGPSRSTVNTFGQQGGLNLINQEPLVALEHARVDSSPVRNRPLPAPPAIHPVKMNELPIKREIFKGGKDAAMKWLDDFEAAIKANHWNDEVSVRYFPTFLRDAARDWFTSMVQPTVTRSTKWLEIKEKFLRFFIGKNVEQVIKLDIKKCRQNKDEPGSEFIARMMRLMSMVQSNKSEQEKVEKIKKKLLDSYQDRMVGQHPKTMVELNDLCFEVEERLASAKRRYQYLQKDEKRSPRGQYNNKARDSKTGSAGEKNETGKDTNVPVQCTFCKKKGHIEENCWLKNGKPKNNAKANHTIEKSVNATEEEALDMPKPVVSTYKNICSIVGTASQTLSEAISCPVYLNSQRFQAMVDTGFKLSMVRSDVATSLGLVPDGKDLGLVGADRSTLHCEGLIDAKVEIRAKDTTKIAKIKFAVVKNLCVPVLLGWELLGWFEILINPAKKSILFLEGTNGMQTAEDVTLPARSEKMVATVVPAYIKEGTSLMTVPFNFTPNLLVANAIDKVKMGQVDCLIANLDQNCVTLKKGTKIANFELMEEEENKNNIAAIARLGDTNEVIQIGDALDEMQAKQVTNLCSKYKDVFSIAGELGETSLVQHDIELEPNAQPVVEALRRRPLIHRQEAEKQVKKMLEDGIIEESSSPWASAYVLVKKKSGEMRLCIDFRKLNEKTKKNVFPLPNIEDCLEPLSGNMFFSQLDMASGYWQIKMSDRAKEYTAFRTEKALYQFKRMPFGLCNAPASFQRLVNALFANLTGVHLQVFIDDICVATPTWKKHLELLEKVFALLQKANLRLKANKCVFGASKVVFLGHELSADGIRQDPEKVRAVRELAPPKDVKEVRRVLGLFGFYRRFVKNFAQISAPITLLMRKESKFEWTQEHQTAFDKLKSELCRGPVLAHFNHHDRLALKTDASYTGIAAILLQQQKGDWHLITCASRRLSGPEENYPITELEGLALVYGVQKFRNYILGKEV